jgi:hypothetical protein
MFSAVTTLCFGAMALPFALLSPSLPGIFITAGLFIVGVVEFKGSQRMRRAEVSAASMLGKNQLAFLGFIILYCAMQMVSFSPEQVKAAALSPEVRAQLGSLPNLEELDRQIERFAPLVTYGLYGLIILLSIGFQGGMAVYYFSRRRHLELFRQSTPEWVRQIFIETGA